MIFSLEAFAVAGTHVRPNRVRRMNLSVVFLKIRQAVKEYLASINTKVACPSVGA
jgi:hypothetical protein